MAHDRDALENTHVEEIRKICREAGLRGARILQCSKSDMISYLVDGVTPFAYRENQDAPVPKPFQPDPTGGLINIDALAELLRNKLKVSGEDSRFDTLLSIVDKLNDKVDEIGKNPGIKAIEVKVGEMPVIKIDGVQHEKFADVLTLCNLRRNVFLYGPAGTGKTQLAKNIGKALSLPCYCQSVSAQSSIIMLSGYHSATGQYIGSTFRNAYENGGVYCLDEIDAGNPNVLIWLNSAIENGECTFPDGIVKRHEDFICIGTGNTPGTGATKEFQGRLAQDEALLSRFARVPMDICVEIEKAMAGGNTQWYEYCLLMREKLERLGIRKTITSRAIRDGAIALAAGMAMRSVQEYYVFAGLSASDRERLK